MITLKQFRRRPINNDPRGIPVFIAQGMHSIPKTDPEEFRGLPALVQKSLQEDSKSTPNIKVDMDTPYNWKQGAEPDWNPQYDFNQDPYYAKFQGFPGHAYQKGRARRIAELPGSYDALEGIRDEFKLDNQHWSEARPEDDTVQHIISVHKALSKIYKGTLHDELHKYSSDSSSLNRYLYQSYDNGKEIEPEFHHHDIAELDKHLEGQKLPEPLIVYSGVKFNVGMRAAKNAYNRVVMPGYLSSAIDFSSAQQFARPLQRGTEKEQQHGDKPSEKHYLRIHLPAGHAGEYLGTRSNYDHESEFLIPRMTTLQVMPNPKIIRTKNPHAGILSTVTHHVWDVHPVKP